jgi:hypothetical protein
MANNVNTGMYSSRDIFFGNYEVNFKYYDLQNKRWSVWNTIGYTDAEVSLTPTVDYAEFKALVPQITIANNISGYLQELRFTIAEIMLRKMARILGGQDITQVSGGQSNVNTTFNDGPDFVSKAVVVPGSGDNLKRIKLEGNVVENSINLSFGSLTTTYVIQNGVVQAPYNDELRIDFINGEYYLTILVSSPADLNSITSTLTLNYNTVKSPLEKIGLIDDVSILMRYFAFAVIGRNSNAGDGRWLVWFIPRAQMNGLPTLRYAPNDYPKYEASFKALASIQEGVSPFDTQASLNLCQILEIPPTQVISGNTVNITRSDILATLGHLLDTQYLI